MKFSIATALAFASAVFAQGPTDGFNAIIKPTQDEEVAAGSTYKIEWQYNDAFPGSVSIDLLGGTEPKTLAVVDAIAAGVDPTTESYEWEVPSDLTHATYGIMITLESNAKTFQYGFPFHITGQKGSGGSSSATGSATETSTETETKSSAKPTKTGTSSGSATKAEPTVTSSSATHGNSTATNTGVTAPSTTLHTSTTAEEPTTAQTTAPLATNAAAVLGAGSFAMLGGVAMAVLAL